MDEQREHYDARTEANEAERLSTNLSALNTPVILSSVSYDAATWDIDPAALLALRSTGLSAEDALLRFLEARRLLSKQRFDY